MRLIYFKVFLISLASCLVNPQLIELITIRGRIPKKIGAISQFRVY